MEQKKTVDPVLSSLPPKALMNLFHTLAIQDLNRLRGGFKLMKDVIDSNGRELYKRKGAISVHLTNTIGNWGQASFHQGERCVTMEFKANVCTVCEEYPHLVGKSTQFCFSHLSRAFNEISFVATGKFTSFVLHLLRPYLKYSTSLTMDCSTDLIPRQYLMEHFISCNKGALEMKAASDPSRLIDSNFCKTIWKERLRLENVCHMTVDQLEMLAGREDLKETSLISVINRLPADAIKRIILKLLSSAVEKQFEFIVPSKNCSPVTIIEGVEVKTHTITILEEVTYYQKEKRAVRMMWMREGERMAVGMSTGSDEWMERDEKIEEEKQRLQNILDDEENQVAEME